MSSSSVRIELRKKSSPARAKTNAWFFKTKPGEYGEGDIFIGVTVPQVRAIAKKYRDLPLDHILELLHSPEHEFRLAALIIMVERFKKAAEPEREVLYETYVANTRWINNWDLVDTSASYIVGGYLASRPKKVLVQLARSNNIWERRVAIIATFYFIVRGEYVETFRVAKILLADQQDLIHKAVGWMLREVGKRCGQEVEEEFLKKHYKTMPRTMLRYAIERFAPARRKAYLKGEIF